MKVSELIEKLDLEVTAGANEVNREVKGCYIGDLMSLAMTGIGEKDIWITIQTNMNVVAVAALAEAACVIMADGLTPDANAATKADNEGVVLLSSQKSAYEIAKALGELGI